LASVRIRTDQMQKVFLRTDPQKVIIPFITWSNIAKESYNSKIDF